MERLGDILSRLEIQDAISAASTGNSSVASVSDDKPSCARCRGAGYLRRDVPAGHPDFGQLVVCACRADELQGLRRARLERLSNLGPLVRLTFESLAVEGRSVDPASRERFRRVVDQAREFAAHPEGWLLLAGPGGSGKTHLAAAIANRRLADGEPVVFVVVPDLLDHLRSTFSPSSSVRYDDLFESIRETPLLVLDDLGTQSSTAWAQEKLFQLLNHRYNARLPTILTTNRRPEDLDERLRSRLLDPSLTTLCIVDDWEKGALQRLGGMALERLREMTFATFDLRGMTADEDQRTSLRKVFGFAQSYADAPSGWLVLLGATGTGKTHLAAAIANARVELGETCHFVTAPDLLDHLRAAYAPDSKLTYDEAFEAIKSTPLLVLDDIGAHSSTPWAVEKLYQLVNYRYNAKLPTVITTNVEIDRLEERVASRMMDQQLSTAFLLDVPSYRLMRAPPIDRRSPRGRANPRRGPR